MRGGSGGRHSARGVDMRLLWEANRRSVRWFEGTAGATQARRTGDRPTRRDLPARTLRNQADQTRDTAMSFRYFGPWEPDGGGVRFPTPIGKTCYLCDEIIDVGDCGSYVWDGANGELIPSHRECAFREVIGGIGHLTDHAMWCEIVHDPDAGRSYRDSALAVWEWTRQHPISGLEGAS